jgi:hypothetical protein
MLVLQLGSCNFTGIQDLRVCVKQILSAYETIWIYILSLPSDFTTII